MSDKYWVKSDVYSMDFWMQREITGPNFTIESIDRDEYKKIRDKIRDDREHYKTGELIIEIPDDVDVADIKDYYNKFTNRLHTLLVFLHGHDVPIHGYELYKINEGIKVPIETSFSSMYVGRVGSGSANIFHGMNTCINHCLPLLMNDEFVDANYVLKAMYMYNSALDHSLLETKFQLLWIGIESLANKYYENNVTDLLLSRSEWKDIKEYLEKYLEGIGKKEVYDRLISKISFLRRGTIKEKIEYMLISTEYDLGTYVEEFRFIYDNMRVPIFHGKGIDWNLDYKPVEKVFRTKRLLEKILFKALGFYENDMIHRSIKADDLSARM